MLQHQPHTPSSPAAGAETLTDSLGRIITLRMLNPADMLDLIDAGGSSASNPAWMRYATAIAGVAAIDGVPAPLPNTKVQLRHLANRLGNEGMTALAERKQTLEAQARRLAEETGDAPDSAGDTEQALAKN